MFIAKALAPRRGVPKPLKIKDCKKKFVLLAHWEMVKVNI